MNLFSVFWQARYPKPLSEAAIAARQAKGFAHLRGNIMPKSPFYAGFADKPLAAWPLMDKRRMMAAFGEINTVGLRHDQALAHALRAEEARDFSPMLGQVALGLSTGTSGQRGLFATNRRERGLWAALMLGRFLPHLLRPQRVAFFLRANNRLYESITNPMLSFTFYDLLAGIEGHLAPLQAQDPTVLIAPAQILAWLAQAQLRGDIRLRPQVVIAVAEVTSPEDGALITRAFGRPLDQVYQCTEGVLAMTCRAGNLHLNEGHIHFEREIIDPESGAFVPIITDLARETQPILRYRLDDVLVPSRMPCPCGCKSQRLDRIEGRCDDILYWRGLRGGLRLVPSDVIRQAIAGAAHPVGDYRAVQSGPDRLQLALEETSPEAQAEITARLAAQAAALEAALPQLEFKHGFAADPARKRRRVMNAPKPEPEAIV